MGRGKIWKLQFEKVRQSVACFCLLFLVPAFAFLVYARVPFVWNGVMSFQQWDGFSAPQWVGADNYAKAFTNGTSRLSLQNSVFLGLVSTAGSVLLGLFLAALVFKVYRKEGAFIA